MKLWISGELDHTVAEDFRLASIAVEDFVNERIVQFDANEANDWDVIAIIRNDENFEERIRFSNKDGMDLRLTIPYKEFMEANPTKQKHLVIALLDRSLGIILNKFPKAFEAGLLQQILNEAKNHA